MKSILLISLALFCAQATAKIKLDNVSGINGVSNLGSGNKSLVLKLDAADPSDFVIEYSSTAIPNGPASTPKMETVIENQPVSLLALPVPAVIYAQNQPVTLTVAKSAICEAFSDFAANGSSCLGLVGYSQTFRIGLDGAGDGLTVGTGDDSLTLTIEIQ